MPLILPNDIANGLPADGDKLEQNFESIQSYVNQEVINRDGSTAMTSALLLPGPPTQPNQAATKAYVDSWAPVGIWFPYGGDSEPAGWMFCRGQAISRATYAALFAVLGTKYGGGDGSTTFNIPSMQGRAPMGFWPGGTWAATNGAMIGEADAVLVWHGHGGNTGTESADHSHAYSGTTSNENAQHNHGNWGGGDFLSSSDTGMPLWILQDGAPRAVFHAPTSHWQNQNHQHVFSGNTGGRSTAHNHGITAEGVPGTNRNISPGVVCNFIMKVQ